MRAALVLATLFALLLPGLAGAAHCALGWSCERPESVEPVVETASSCHEEEAPPTPEVPPADAPRLSCCEDDDSGASDTPLAVRNDTPRTHAHLGVLSDELLGSAEPGACATVAKADFSPPPLYRIHRVLLI